MKGSQRLSLYYLAPDQKGRFSRIASGYTLGQAYTIVRWLGRGSYGDVYLAKNKQTFEEVAIKIARSQQPYQTASVEEAKKLRMFSSPYVIGLIDEGFFSCKGKRFHYIVMPYLTINLYQYTQELKSSGRQFTDKMSKQVAHDSASGLREIHRKGYIHSDLKPENIMWDRKACCWVIIDVGSAHQVSSFTETGHYYIQSRWWRAPEVLLQILYPDNIQLTSAIDMWSLGCILYEVATNVPLFQGTSSAHTLRQIEEKIGTHASPIPFYPKHENISPSLRNLIRFLVTYDRLTAQGVIDHPYLLSGVPGVPDALERDEGLLDSISVTSTPSPSPYVLTRLRRRKQGVKRTERKRRKKVRTSKSKGTTGKRIDTPTVCLFPKYIDV